MNSAGFIAVPNEKNDTSRIWTTTITQTQIGRKLLAGPLCSLISVGFGPTEYAFFDIAVREPAQGTLPVLQLCFQWVWRHSDVTARRRQSAKSYREDGGIDNRASFVGPIAADRTLQGQSERRTLEARTKNPAEAGFRE